MSWEDRLREAAYTSPSGVRVPFQYENVTRAFTKKTAAYDFPDADGTFVQDLGTTSRRFPLRVIFWGPDYDQDAEQFEKALAERGPGLLEHPAYGAVTAVPFGTVTRRDDLKTAANQAVIEVEFFETVGLAYPATQDDAAAEIEDAVEAFNEAAAEEFSESSDYSGALSQAEARGGFVALLDQAKAGLSDLSDDVGAVYDSIDSSIDTLIADPLTLAFQTIQLLESPGRAASLVSDRLEAYRALADSILSGDGAGNYATDDLYASTTVAGAVLSVTGATFETKPETLSAAEDVLALFDDVVAWRETNAPGVDTGGAYQQLQRAVALTVGYLVELSFTLKQERRVVLDRARTVVDLVAEIYGSVDDRIDFFINSNRLTGSEIMEIPRGRLIVYYV